MLKIARCTVDWRSIRDLNSGGATNALSHFECDPFDLLGNAPYVNLQKSFPEKGEKSRREQQILSCRKCADFNDNTMENQEEFPKCRLDFECGPFNRLGTSPNLCYIPGPDPPTNSAGGNQEEQQDRTSNIIQFELGWNPHGSKGFSRLTLRIGNLISNHYTSLDDDGKSGTIAVTTEPQNTPLKVAIRWLLSL